MSDLSRRVEKLEELTGDRRRGTALIRVNGDCKQAATCQKINGRVEAAAANGPVVRLITNVDLHGEEKFSECRECNIFENKDTR